MGWVRWTTGRLPRGTVVGPTCQVTCAKVGPTWVMWSNREMTCGKMGAEVVSCCAAMCQLGFDSLLMWITVTVSCGIGWVRCPAVVVPFGIGSGEVALLWSAT
jgi:hypothetical protein